MTTFTRGKQEQTEGRSGYAELPGLFEVIEQDCAAQIEYMRRCGLSFFVDTGCTHTGGRCGYPCMPATVEAFLGDDATRQWRRVKRRFKHCQISLPAAKTAGD